MPQIIKLKETVVQSKEQVLKSDGFNNKVQFTERADSEVKIEKFFHEKERKPFTPMPMINSDIKLSTNASFDQQPQHEISVAITRNLTSMQPQQTTSKNDVQSQTAASVQQTSSPKKNESKHLIFNESIPDISKRPIISKSFSLTNMKSKVNSLRETMSFQNIQEVTPRPIVPGNLMSKIGKALPSTDRKAGAI